MTMQVSRNCGFDCKACRFFQLCGGCSNFECLVRRCVVEGVKVEGVTHPSSLCIYQLICPIGATKSKLRGILSPLFSREETAIPDVSSADKARHISEKAIELGSFVPVVSLCDERSWFWKHSYTKIKVPAIVVRLEELIHDRDLQRTVRKVGVHEFLNFDGSVVLSSVMPDELTEGLSAEEYANIIEETGVDGAFTLDRFVYFDDPLVLSWKQVLRMVADLMTLTSKVKCQVFAIAKGANIRQLGWLLESVSELGIKHVVYPVRELRHAPAKKRLFFENIFKATSKSGAKLLVYGSLFPDFFMMPYLEKVSFSSLAWFLRALRGEAVLDRMRREVIVKNAGFKCRCPVCRGKNSSELLENLEILAAHNLYFTLRFYKGCRSWASGTE